MKKKLFWIIYYVVAITTLSVALIVFRERITFTWHSAFPIGYSAYLLLLIWYSHSNFRTHLWVFFENRRYNAYFSNRPEDERPHETFEESHPQLHPDGILNSKVYLFFIPIFAFFIFFFSDEGKFHSIWIFLIVAVIITVLGVRSMITDDTDGRRARFKKELEEQKKKESMGKWK